MAIFNESYLFEAVNKPQYTNKTLKGKKIYILWGPSKKLDYGIKLVNKNWNSIVEAAAERIIDHLKRKGDEDINTRLSKYSSPKDFAKDLYIISDIGYRNEGDKYNPICGDFSISFDTDPYLDKFHLFTLDVTFDENEKPKYDYSYDG